MIKFFRKIRQHLLTENKFSKYLLYAFGEIALVMVGILLALQVNNWNEEKKERRIEKQRYQNILNDLINDEVSIDQMIKTLIIKQDLHYYLYNISQNNQKSDSTIYVSRINVSPELNLITGKNQLTELEFIKDLGIRREINTYVKLENAALTDAIRLESVIKNDAREYFSGINATIIDKYFSANRYENIEIKDMLDMNMISKHFKDTDFKALLIKLRMSTSNTLITLKALKEKNMALQSILREKQ
jgi:hypothetical protein